MASSLILIGPSKAGKHTVATLLEQKTGLVIGSTERFNSEDFKEWGFDNAEWYEAFNKDSHFGAYYYTRPFSILAVEKLLAETEKETIVILQADEVVYEDKMLFDRVKEALAPFQKVVLLLPSPDLETTLQVLKERFNQPMQQWHELNNYFVNHPANYQLAKQIAYNKNKTPVQTSNEVLRALDSTQSKTLILIGPIATGKSTVSKILAQELGVPRYSLDELRWDYFKELNYDEEKARTALRTDGPLGEHHYWERFNSYALKRLLTDHQEGVFDLGGGHTIYDDPILFQQVNLLLAPYQNVVLLLPSPDRIESAQILKERFESNVAPAIKLNEFFVRLPYYEELAKQIVYTDGKTPEQACNEIINRLLL